MGACQISPSERVESYESATVFVFSFICIVVFQCTTRKQLSERDEDEGAE